MPGCQPPPPWPSSLTAMADALTARQRTRGVVFSTDPVGPEMPGPAIRAWELANVLGQHFDVVLASTVAVSGTHPCAEMRLAAGPALRGPGEGAGGAIRDRVEGPDAPFAPSTLVYRADDLRETAKPVVVDIYDPYHLENL